MLPFELTKDTPYLALSGELWSVFYEYFNRNWPCYKGFLLYIVIFPSRSCFALELIYALLSTHYAFYVQRHYCLCKSMNSYHLLWIPYLAIADVWVQVIVLYIAVVFAFLLQVLLISPVIYFTNIFMD